MLVIRGQCMYITYDINTKRLVRIDTEKIILDKDSLAMIEKDITLDDDVCLNMSTYKINDDGQFYVDEELVEEQKLNELRAKREPLLKAFDIYKSNLIVGAISLPEEQKQEVITWYNEVLDLSEDAINNPPTVISKYL
jgi:hypothetical protein